MHTYAAKRHRRRVNWRRFLPDSDVCSNAVTIVLAFGAVASQVVFTGLAVLV